MAPTFIYMDETLGLLVSFSPSKCPYVSDPYAFKDYIYNNK